MDITIKCDEIVSIKTTRYDPEISLEITLDAQMIRDAIRTLAEKLGDQGGSHRITLNNLLSDLAAEYLSPEQLNELAEAGAA